MRYGAFACLLRVLAFALWYFVLCSFLKIFKGCDFGATALRFQTAARKFLAVKNVIFCRQKHFLLFAFANNFRRSAAVCKIQKAIAPSGLKSRSKSRVYFHDARYKNISQARTSNVNRCHNKKSPFFH